LILVSNLFLFLDNYIFMNEWKFQDFKQHSANLITKLRQEYHDGVSVINELMSKNKTGL
jgi:hypothetical protein